MAAIRVVASVLVLVACQREPAPVVTPPAPKQSDAGIDGRIDAAIDAGIDAAVASPACDSVARFSFGTLALPTGWCWRRTEEGDDLSGIVVDTTGTTRFTYQAFAFANAPDVCAGKRAIAATAIRGVAVRTCELANGHRCASFRGGAANICTTDTRTTELALDGLAQTIAPGAR